MSRRSSRELAFKVLYQVDAVGTSQEEALNYLVQHYGDLKIDLIFAKELVDGVLKYKSEIDNIIKDTSHSWNIERMFLIDRNIIRLALFEIVFREDIPAGVAINEAVEIAKEYGTSESWRFVNGVLGKVAPKLLDYRLKYLI